MSYSIDCLWLDRNASVEYRRELEYSPYALGKEGFLRFQVVGITISLTMLLAKLSAAPPGYSSQEVCKISRWLALFLQARGSSQRSPTEGHGASETGRLVQASSGMTPSQLADASAMPTVPTADSSASWWLHYVAHLCHMPSPR